jgi:pyrimidine oxygenase
MQFSLQEMDAIFLTGRDNEDLGRISRDVKARARAFGRSIKTYTMMTFVFGETDTAAQAQADRFRVGLDEGALKGMMRAYGFLDAELGQENAFVASTRSSFMTPRLIGSPQTIADEAITLMEQAELDGLMLIFPDYIEGLNILAERVQPQIRAHFPVSREAITHAS